MKKLSGLLRVACGVLLMGLALPARAQNVPTSIPPAWMLNTYAGTVLSTATSTNGNNSNSVAFASPVAKSHTFELMVLNGTGTNASVYLDRSLDGTNWVTFYTNTATSGSTNDTTLIGKWFFFRARFTGTNASAVVNYFGQF